jgi:hypothetical protein
VLSGVSEVEAISTAATNSYWILLPCYVLILFFAMYGHKLKSWKLNFKKIK